MVIVQINGSRTRVKFYTKYGFRRWFRKSIAMFAKLATRPVYHVWDNGRMYSVKPWR